MNISVSNGWILSPAVRLLALACVLGVVGTRPSMAAQPRVASVTVSFRDLDIGSAAGAHALYRRIQGAARQVCGPKGADLIEQGYWNSCYRKAIDDAVTKVNSPLLTSIHTHRPPAMTAMVSK
jgi:UrcA family protein